MARRRDGLLRRRWSADGGYGELLRIALPLIVSTGAVSVQHFVDRMFLTWFSPEAVAAVTPAGMLNFTIMSLFIGTAQYVNTFAAQYYGAGRHERIGPSVWQGVYVAAVAGVVLWGLIPASYHLFAFFGHEAQVLEYETTYFRILCYGGLPAVGASALAGFYTGRGSTRPVMWVNLAATGVNIVLDYLLIFGHFGMPRLGIAGAAIATLGAFCFSFAAYLVMVTRREFDDRFHTRRGWRFDRALFARLMHYGFPSGVHLFIEIAGFTIFILSIGRLGTVYLAATNIAFNINTIAFLPMIGLGMAITVLVGQKLGMDRPDLAARCVWSGLHIGLCYTGGMAVMFFVVPGVFLAPFAAGAVEFGAIRAIVVVLLRFVAFYTLFDAVSIVFSYALRGAGDTRFVMNIIISASIGILVGPSIVFLGIFRVPVYVGWLFPTLFVVVLGVSFTLRFLNGAWRSMRVIESIPPAVPPSFPDTPGYEPEF